MREKTMALIANLDEHRLAESARHHAGQPLRDAVHNTLSARFGRVPEAWRGEFDKIQDSEQLWYLLYDALTAPGLEAFGQLLEAPGVEHK